MRPTQLTLLSLCALAMLGGRAAALTDGRAATSSLQEPVVGSISTPSAPGRGGILGLSIGTYGGMDYGSAKELVYFSGGGFNDYKVSELDWPLQPLYYLGVRLGTSSSSSFLLRFDFRQAIPSNVGYVQDSDYLNGDGLRTNYSRHTGVLVGAFSLQTDIGVRIRLPDRIIVSPFARFAFRDIKWSAQDGYLQYPPQSSPPYTYWSPTEPKVYLSGEVASYEQRYVIPAVGLEGELNSGGILSIAARLAFSPFAWISDIDNHFLRNLRYYDSMTFCTYVEPDLRLSFRPIPALELSVGVSYSSVKSGPDGLIVTEDTSTGIKTSSAGTGSTAGASIQTVSTTVEVTVSR